MHYNFVRIHQSLRVTPAMAAGVTQTLWSLTDMVRVIEDRRSAENRARCWLDETYPQTNRVRTGLPDSRFYDIRKAGVWENPGRSLVQPALVVRAVTQNVNTVLIARLCIPVKRDSHICGPPSHIGGRRRTFRVCSTN
jgi:hypothetical protein